MNHISAFKKDYTLKHDMWVSYLLIEAKQTNKLNRVSATVSLLGRLNKVVFD